MTGVTSVPTEHALELQTCFVNGTAKSGIVGMGCVGLPLALLFSGKGFPVARFDVDSRKVETLNSGGSYIVRVPPTEIQSARDRGFSAAGDYAAGASMGRGRHYDLNMTCTPLDDLSDYDCVLIVTDHSAYDYERIASESQLVIDTRNATRGIASPKVIRC